MSQWSLLKYRCLAYFSQPAADRVIYRAIRRHRVRTIVELGVGAGLRTQRMIRVAQQFSPQYTIRYTGIDLFEARPPEQSQIKLRVAYMEFKRLTPCIQLVPGDPYSALGRAANGLAATDLLVIAADQDPECLLRAWTFVPRMLHDQSLVYREEPLKGSARTRFVPVERSEIQRLADSAPRRLRAA